MENLWKTCFGSYLTVYIMVYKPVEKIWDFSTGFTEQVHSEKLSTFIHQAFHEFFQYAFLSLDFFSLFERFSYEHVKQWYDLFF